MDEPTIEERVSLLEEENANTKEILNALILSGDGDEVEKKARTVCTDLKQLHKLQSKQGVESSEKFDRQDDYLEALHDYNVRVTGTKNAYIQKVRDGRDVPPLAEWDPYIRMLATKPKD